MDAKKDIQGHSSMSINLQGGMTSFSVSLSKRSERLATALYLVTNFLSDNEPLKARLRTLSLDLVRVSSDVRYGAPVSESDTFERIKGNIGETLALLELAFIAGLISEMNFTILKREYASVRGVVEVKKASRESRADTILGDTFFGESFIAETATPKITIETRPLSPEKISGMKPFAEGYSIGHDKGQKNNTMSFTMSDTPRRDRSKIISKGHSKDTKENGATKSTQQVQYSIQKDSRRTRIVKLVKDNREVSIKDIVAHFPDVSEKTIQRELVSLTEEKVLKKIGERRWSRYTLA